MSKKMITIPYNGPIFPKATVQGPIETPYAEDVSTIGTLLSQAYPVTEHLENGATVVLDLNNFQKKFSEALILNDEKVEAIVVEEVTGSEVPEADKVPEDKPEEPQLTKKERKKLEQQRREEEQRKQEQELQADVTI